MYLAEFRVFDFAVKAVVFLIGAIVWNSSSHSVRANDDAIALRARKSMAKATQFMTKNIADHGGYAWVSSADGEFSHGEGVAGPDRVWVQPPGTPAVGMAFLDAYEATQDKVHLDAARDAATALAQGQLRSGGWGYSIDFSPEARAKIPYRVGPNGGRDKIPPFKWPGGWDIWRSRKYKTNKTLIDDDTTPAAIRFLARLDQTLNFKDARIHEAVVYSIESVMAAQYPIGAWGHNYDRFPQKKASKTHYPEVKASYPESWSRTSTNDFNGCYMLNDRQTMNMIETMMLVADIYNDDRYWYSARKGGEFLLLAQMPDPQPAWAQQYDRMMKPVWDRKFEPPAITGGESQDAMWTLLRLYQGTKDKRFLEPIPKALAYFKKSLRDDGKLARYYELKSNRPIYFNKKYEITYDDRKMPDHYSFVQDSELGAIEQWYRKLLTDTDAPERTTPIDTLRRSVSRILSSQAESGAWLEPGFVRDQRAKKVIPEEGVVSSQTFIDNLSAISQFLRRIE